MPIQAAVGKPQNDKIVKELCTLVGGWGGNRRHTERTLYFQGICDEYFPTSLKRRLALQTFPNGVGVWFPRFPRWRMFECQTPCMNHATRSRTHKFSGKIEAVEMPRG